MILGLGVIDFCVACLGCRLFCFGGCDLYGVCFGFVGVGFWVLGGCFVFGLFVRVCFCGLVLCVLSLFFGGGW